jgi:hypothetical protein
MAPRLRHLGGDVPAGPTASKEIRHLALLETVEIPNFSQCLSQCNVSASGSIGMQQPEFEPLEHSVYLGRERLGRYSRIGPKLYAAFDAKDRLLGEFKRHKEAYAAVSIARGARIRNVPSAKRAR